MSDVIDAMRRVMVWLGNNMGIIFYCDILEARNPAFMRKSEFDNEDSKKLEDKDGAKEDVAAKKVAVKEEEEKEVESPLKKCW